MRKKYISPAKRIVVKLGTSILSRADGSLNRSRIDNIARQIHQLFKLGKKVTLVSSGAIGCGMSIMKLATRPRLLPELQAAAACGQGQLMKIYDESFRPHQLITAQILLTQEDLKDRQRYLNARNTLSSLTEIGAVAIVNENDTVATDEIKFGDNDYLASLVANLFDADLLIILSDIDGLTDKSGRVIRLVKDLSGLEKLIWDKSSQISVGGMQSKLKAASVASQSGIAMVIANGGKKDILLELMKGEELGTLFIPRSSKLAHRKRWIAFSSRTKGSILVDKGASQALGENNKSLLARGIIGVRDEFNVGDVVSILDHQHKEFARGLTNYSSGEIDLIKGVKTSEIKSILGYKYYDEIVHRDNLVVL